ncbi:MAG: helix-turn-helix transcriptional regulator [Clostridiales bacterium]|nr:helix-turn-helix transcriptional regulator [Clostridiales bacterium]
MLSNQIGKIIKEARLNKKLTQSEVVGDFITRNMLSQIESGAAYPSVKTLEYLTRKLEIPMQNLMADNDEEKDTVLQNQDLFLKAKNLFKDKKYQSAIEILLEMTTQESLFFDEACAMLARIYLEFAKNSDDISYAIKYAELAEEYATKGIYANKEIPTSAILLMNTLAKNIKKNT